MTHRHSNSGIVLVNVLVILAIAGALMLVLVNNQDANLKRISRSADASILEQIVFGAEASVIDALSTDLNIAPDADHLNEDWAKRVIQENVQLPTGRFSLQVSDLQARFNINQLAEVTATSQAFAQRLMTALDLPPETADQIARILKAIGPVSDPQDLAAFGIPQNALNTLAPHITALPIDTSINLNTVSPFLLSVMLQNKAQADQLIRIRQRQGEITRQTLQNTGTLRPQNSAFTSNAYLVDILAEAGSARMHLQSLILRQNTQNNKAITVLKRRLLDPQNIPPST